MAPKNVRFQYRQIGFDKDWIDAGSRREAWYTNLPPGEYTFVVRAANSDGVWNPVGASFRFELRPPLLRTPLAYVCYALVALLVAWGAMVLRTRQLVRRQYELTQIVAERTGQLEAEKSALEAIRRELQVRATHDSLTGLFNRAAILEHMEREMERAKRDKTSLGVLIADLDHFKKVNDTYGHLCGDEVLRETAERLRHALRGYDIVGRYGGEEFLILLPGWDMVSASGRISEILDSIRSKPFRFAGGEIHLTCSLGVSVFRPELPPATIENLLDRADAAMYAAKNLGRNRVEFDAGSAQSSRAPAGD